MNEENISTLTIADFVKETITQIAAGLQTAQAEARDNGVKIFPESYGDKTKSVDIAFDLAITQSAENAKGGHFKLGVMFANVEISAGKDTKISSGIINRVQFTLPIDFVVYNPVDSNAPQQDWSGMPRAGTM